MTNAGRGRLTIAALGLLCLASLAVGVGDMRLGALGQDPRSDLLFFASRAPRTIAVMLTGASMAVAGLVMQVIARNRFVEPTTAGAGESAALGLLLATLFLPAASLPARMAVATGMALAGTALFLAVARRLPPAQPLLVPLVGLVYGGIIGAVVTFIGYETDLLQYIAVWVNGEFSGVLRGRYELLWLGGALAALAYAFADRLTIASLGREASLGLGLNYRAMEALGLGVVAMTTAAVVATVGMVPFLGLVVPNLVSRVMGDNLRLSLPYVAAVGAGLTLACDLIGRIVRYPYEIPVGTVLGVVGAALFLWLLLGRERRA
ncbi:iron chelate uptake ABC transporter family permease subunit [Amaricoccus sp.]|uniref:ABC transporter permease n=1 Tax=Amaricoccus sp. TaxID=1872485 RepID=UPI001B43985F|nr:iron chelate uptake ABC transporter family permease subunit [Amaricoccus sp.]MBP7000710.1 iron chelate uptake ABC transporter family permease subunit [Amaricoccus sp.]